MIFCFSIDIMKVIKTVPVFYEEMIWYWYEIKESDINTYAMNLDPTDIRDQIIWANSSICRDLKNTIMFSHWIQSGIACMFVGDICPQVFIPMVDIRNKLIDKTNYIAEMYPIKQAIPNIWIKKLAVCTRTRKSN